MKKTRMSLIRNKAGLIYAIGIIGFSVFFIIIAIIAELISRNS